MSKQYPLLVLAASLLAAGPLAPEEAVPQQVAAGVAAPAEAWSLARGTPRSTGESAGDLPRRLELLWKMPTENGAFEAPATIVDGMIYAGNLNGDLHAVDLTTGKQKWSYFSELGYRAAPAVQNGLLFVGDADGIIHCVDVNTGQPKWKYATDAEINSSANFYKDTVLVGSQDATLYCLKQKTGELVWKYTIDEQIQCGITVAGEVAFLAGCDGRLHVINVKNGEKDREPVNIEDPTGVTPAVPDDFAYFGTEGGTFFAVNWMEGKVAWTFQDPVRKQQIRSSAGVNEDVVVFGSRSKKVYGLDRKTGTQLWAFATKGRVDSSPVMVGRRVYFGSADGRLYALDAKSGRETWSYEAGGGFGAGPAVAQGKLVIGSDDGILYCFGEK